MSPPPDSFQGVSPVLLSSSCDVAQNNSNIPGLLDLVYPFRKAIIIEEIRWDMRMPFASGLELGSLVSVKMQLGQNYLMRDPVPAWILGTEMALSQEEAVDLSLVTTTAYSHYRWRLPEPLYLEAGQVLNSTFFRGNDGFGDSINVQVSYAGRTVAPNQPVPRVVAIPYATYYATTLGQTYGQSNEKHLFNPFDKPMRVQRLTGGSLQFISGADSSLDASFTPAVPGSDVTVLMNDSWGGNMVQNNTGPGDVFDASRRAWTVDSIMPRKGMYEARVWNIKTNHVVHIGMIGTREESL